MNKKFLLIVLLGAAAAAFFLWPKKESEHVVSEETLVEPENRPLVVAESNNQMQKLQTVSLESANTVAPPVVGKPQESESELTYVVEDGVAVINEDIVIGIPRSAKTYGRVALENVFLWEDGVVPFHIQADAPNRSEIIQAIAGFANTPIKFIPYTDQEDVLVFESGSGCKSYLGKVGGMQPIWINSGCGVTEITHEIMHALGFIHEQNRSDRDQYVEVIWDNVQEKLKHNFELFPSSLMVMSGGSDFDYESIMLYKPTAFTNNGGFTIRTKTEKALSPGAELSPKDLQRLSKAYGRN